jgi:hypothetical protein
MTAQTLTRLCLRSTFTLTLTLTLTLLLEAVGFAKPAEVPALQQAAGGGKLTIVFNKPRLVLGRASDVGMRITSATPITSLDLSASVGRVERIVQITNKRWAARYVPPDSYMPQVAIIAARARAVDKGRPLIGWRALRLWGKALVRVRAKSGEKVMVQVGPGQFGPVRANSDGIAVVPVVVAPGARFGWHGNNRLKLDLPGFKRLHGVLSRAHVDGAKVETVTLYLFAVRADGTDYRGLSPLIRFTRGSFGTIRPFGTGAWRITLTVPAGEPDQLMVTASLPLAPSASTTLTIERSPDPPRYEEPKPKPVGSLTDDTEEEVKKTDRGGLRPVYFWSGLALSGAVLTAGLVTFILAKDLSDEYHDPATDGDRRLEIQPTGEKLTIASYVSLGVGAGLAVGTTILFFMTDFSGPSVQASMSIDPNTGASLVLTGTF